jgi:hypothetical protein
VLAERRQVDVVLERHRQAERGVQLLGECAPLQARDVLGQPEHARAVLDDAGNADDDAVDALGVEPRGIEQRCA